MREATSGRRASCLLPPQRPPRRCSPTPFAITRPADCVRRGADYRRAIELDPTIAAAHNNLGAVLQQQGLLDEAEACFRRALECGPDDPDAHVNLGIVLTAQERQEEAAAHCRTAVALRPTMPEAHYNLGNALFRMGRSEEAVASFRAAIDLRPDDTGAHNNLGNALLTLGRMDAAVACLRKVIALSPNDPEAHNNCGNACLRSGNPHDAIACFHRALDLRPGMIEARNNLAAALREQGDLDGAVVWLRSVIELTPASAEAHGNLGIGLQAQGRMDAAVASFRRAIALDPDNPEAHRNLAMALLARGDLAEGWAENEWRWNTPNMRPGARGFAQPQWRGEPAEGQTLLIHAEQGFGDTLQFCRFAPLAAARGLRVVVEAQRPLARLLRSLPGVDQVLAHGEPLPPFDLHSPMLSLPLALGTTLASIPNDVPYLQADPAQVAAWHTRLAAASGPGLRIGLAWAGNPRLHVPNGAALDRLRSLPPDLLAPLVGVPGAHFVSLQKDWPEPPANAPLIDFMSEVGDFADTAALVANLDLVISVDTAVAHLAGALGKPVWLLDRFDPDWRWLRERSDSPWS